MRVQATADVAIATSQTGRVDINLFSQKLG